MRVINVGLLKNPLNWATVFLMLVIAGAAGHYFLSLAGFEPAKPQK